MISHIISGNKEKTIMPKVKKMPLRKCLATNTQYPKKDMFRIVRTTEGTIVVDLKGKVNEEELIFLSRLKQLKLLR